MKTCLDSSRLLRASACALAIGLTSQQASAEWMGLADGDYALSLKCFDGSLNCAYTGSGQITISGAGVSFMDMLINGLHFVSDPQDTADLAQKIERSVHTLTPFGFVSLLMATPGYNGSLGLVPGSLYWSYCENVSENACAARALGLAEAQALPAIPEPSTYLLMATGLAALGLWRRRRG